MAPHRGSGAASEMTRMTLSALSWAEGEAVHDLVRLSQIDGDGAAGLSGIRGRAVSGAVHEDLRLY